MPLQATATPALTLCGCGCGQPVRLAPRTQRQHGWVKGQPQRFLNHHRPLTARRVCSDCGGPTSESYVKRCVPCDVARRRANSDGIFLGRVDRSGGPDACWPWTGFVADNGYGQASNGEGKKEWAHRRAYRIAFGEVPDGLTVDHVCHTRDLECRGGPTCPHRRCCNPAHFEAVTRLVNQKRGRSPWTNRRRAA